MKILHSCWLYNATWVSAWWKPATARHSHVIATYRFNKYTKFCKKSSDLKKPVTKLVRTCQLPNSQHSSKNRASYYKNARIELFPVSSAMLEKAGSRLVRICRLPKSRYASKSRPNATGVQCTEPIDQWKCATFWLVKPEPLDELGWNEHPICLIP